MPHTALNGRDDSITGFHSLSAQESLHAKSCQKFLIQMITLIAPLRFTAVEVSYETKLIMTAAEE